MVILYKFINKDNKSCSGGDFDWTEYLPVKNEDGTWTPGKWTPKVSPVLCMSGYHVCVDLNLDEQYLKEQCFVAEAYPDCLCAFSFNKRAYASIRLVKKVEAWNKQSIRKLVRDMSIEYSRDRWAVFELNPIANAWVYQHELTVDRLIDYLRIRMNGKWRQVLCRLLAS